MKHGVKNETTGPHSRHTGQFPLFSPAHVRAQAESPVVHAVLFYSPICGHCEYVINNTLLPLIEKHGGHLQPEFRVQRVVGPHQDKASLNFLPLFLGQRRLIALLQHTQYLLM